jgi:Holliday junction resolvasome RuvABC ATP-dependent DNA helicase subunit
MDKQIFKRILDNMVFAMNLSDDIPEHVMTEIMQSRVAQGTESIFAKPELLEDFNVDVDRNLRPQLGPQSQSQSPPSPLPPLQQKQQYQPQSEKVLFNEVYGYDDLKQLLCRMLASKESVSGVLIGPPASGKTMFLLAIQHSMEENVFFIDTTNASGAGIIDKLFSRPDTKIILVDEIEKMNKRDQNMLLNLLETGILTSTKIRKTAEIEFKGIKLFATSNDIDRLSKPLRSRLIELHLPEYSKMEFTNIVIRLTHSRYKLNEETSKEIARVVWHEMGTKDIRDALQLSKLVTNIDDVKVMAATIMKYSDNNHE